MSTRQASELLYDSEAALRLVDSAIEDLRDTHDHDAARSATPSAELRELLDASGSLGLVGLTTVLTRAYGEIVGTLGKLRESRTVLEKTTVEKLQHMHDKLREVSNATEMAATDILNGLERSVAMVDDMDAKANAGDAQGGADLRNKLRDELFALMGCMQFQDITTQQLSYASSVLVEMETRLAELATILDPATLAGGKVGAAAAAASAPAPAAGPATFDPNASVENAAARQAVADEIFAPRQK
jgi:chemotaxis regulatin CheY-phosphate phosphatase CheZ